jgi:hypothetical protein
MYALSNIGLVSHAWNDVGSGMTVFPIVRLSDSGFYLVNIIAQCCILKLSSLWQTFKIKHFYFLVFFHHVFIYVIMSFTIQLLCCEQKKFSDFPELFSHNCVYFLASMIKFVLFSNILSHKLWMLNDVMTFLQDSNFYFILFTIVFFLYSISIFFGVFLIHFYIRLWLECLVEAIFYLVEFVWII